jgi:hypothetical protein
MARKKFRVVRAIHHGEGEKDQRRYEPGEVVELEENHGLPEGTVEDLDAEAARRRKLDTDSVDDIERQIAELTARRAELVAKQAPAPEAKGGKGKPPKE